MPPARTHTHIKNITKLHVYGCIGMWMPVIMYYAYGSTSPALDACTIIVNWLNVVSYLKGFELTGSLVRMLISVMMDMRGFLMLLVMLIMAFALSLSVLIPHEDEFADFRGAPVHVFNAMLGNVEINWFDDPHEPLDANGTARPDGYTSGTRRTGFSVLADLFFIGFQLLIVIVMLNLLVSILGNTYSKIAEHEHVQMQYERAKCIYEIERHFLPVFFKSYEKFFPRFLHSLEPEVAKRGREETSESRIREDLKEQVELVRGEVRGLQSHVSRRIFRVSLLLEPGMRIRRRDHEHMLRACHFHLWSRTFTGGQWKCSACLQEFEATRDADAADGAQGKLCFICADHYPTSSVLWKPPLRCSFTLCSVCVRNEVQMPKTYLGYLDEEGGDKSSSESTSSDDDLSSGDD